MGRESQWETSAEGKSADRGGSREYAHTQRKGGEDATDQTFTISDGSIR